jgi:hypothetical protein
VESSHKNNFHGEDSGILGSFDLVHMAEATLSDVCDGLVLGLWSAERFDGCAFRKLGSLFHGVAREDVVIPPGELVFCSVIEERGCACMVKRSPELCTGRPSEWEFPDVCMPETYK